MNVRRLIPPFVVALLISGALTWWLGHQLAESKVVAMPVAMRHFVAVSRNMKAGEQIQSSTLQMVDWPASQTLPGALQNLSEAEGRVLLVPAMAGEIVLEPHLAKAGVGTGLSALIPEGMRAISLRSDDVAGVAGFLTPGSQVDVLVTMRSDKDSTLVTSVVLQDVRVLATGQRSEADPDGKPAPADSVTLLVTPHDAEQLTQATGLGKILFVLRNGVDRTITTASALRSASSTVFSTPSSAPASLPPSSTGSATASPTRASGRSTYMIQTISGSKVTESAFEEGRKP